MPAINRDHVALAAKRTFRTNNHIGGGGGVVNVGGISAGVILFLMALIFVIMLFVFYKQDKKRLHETGKPINIPKIICLSALCACGVGFIFFCLSGCGSDGGNNNANGDGNGGGGDGGAPPMQDANYGGGGFMPPPSVPPMQTPDAFSGPVQGEAADPIQFGPE